MKLSIASSDRDHAILVCDEDHNDIAEFFHNEHATVGQSYETALMLARKLVEPSTGRQDEREAIALEIWHRFADSNVQEWEDETHKAEYLLCADSILTILSRSPAPGNGAMREALEIARKVHRDAVLMASARPKVDPEHLRWLHHSYGADEVASKIDAAIDAALAAVEQASGGGVDTGDFDFDNLSDLVARFSASLLEKLKAAERKYGHNSGWMRDDWMAECQQHLLQHLAKGDPRDVAAYCAFMWHHGWSTIAAHPEQESAPASVGVLR